MFSKEPKKKSSNLELEEKERRTPAYLILSLTLPRVFTNTDRKMCSDHSSVRYNNKGKSLSRRQQSYFPSRDQYTSDKKALADNMGFHSRNKNDNKSKIKSSTKKSELKINISKR